MKRTPSARTVLCPVCSASREVPAFTVPRAYASGLSFAAAVFVFIAVSLFASWTAAVWGAGLCGVLFFVGVEVYYGARYRRELTCPVCRFDPILYRRSPERAKEQCLDGLKRREEFLQARWRALQERGSN